MTADLSSIGGSATQMFFGSGNSFTFSATVAAGTTPGVKTLPVTISDAEGRLSNTTISLTVEQPPLPLDHIVISQIYGGGGNASATYRNDYVELYNPTTAAVDLGGWTVQYASATGTGLWQAQPLGGVMQPGEYYLIALASGGTVGATLPEANVTGEINMSGTAGKVALANNGDPLENCPLSDPALVDLVGYGSTANCREGATNAPAPSNTTALLRKNGGAIDTNVNGSDFATGAPNPRRTASISEIGPYVLNTDPRSNGVNAPRDASINVTFTEPVTVDSGWFNINCVATGLHNDATVAVSGRTLIVTPNVNFLAGEQCSVTIFKDTVHDQDTDDSAPNTDTLTADKSWTFTVATGTAPAYPPDVHLTMGNPNGATADINQPNNYLMMKPEYALSYNRDRGAPNWVSWHLADEWVGSLTRVDTFRPDPAVPSDWYRVLHTDYFGSGFDRGHMVPNADRDKETSIPINQATFLMSNMIPQAPDNNQGPWASMENFLRTLLPANELYIVAGGAGTGGTGSNGFTTTFANGHVTVPAQTWKVVLVLPKQSGDDVQRVPASARTIAVIMPNTQGIRTNDWQGYLVSIDQVEALTGYDFFANVPDAVENSIEAGVNGANPPGTTGQSVITAEDTPVAITLSAVSPDANATFTYTVTQPAHGTLSGEGANRVYTPAANFRGTDSFTFKANDGHADSNSSTVTITVAEVNDAPVAANDSKSTQEDTPLSFPASDLTANDTAGGDEEAGQQLTVASVTGGADAHGSVELVGGQITYTPAPNYYGGASFSYQVCDDGTTNGSSDPRCADATVNVTVAAVNDDPVAVADEATTDEDTPVVIDVRANDGDVDGDALSIGAVGGAAKGTTEVVGDSVRYTPNSNTNGADSFSYSVADGHGGTATSTVTVMVNAVNDAPVASGQSVEASEDVAKSITLTASDIEGDGVSFSIVGAPAHGTATLEGATVTYTPATDYYGADSFTFKANDGAQDSNTATITITVSETNDAPTAAGDSKSASEDTPLQFAVAELTNNDTAGAANESSQTLTVTSVTANGETHGAVALAGGQVTYTPESNYHGPASFTYQVCDDGTTNGSTDAKCATAPVSVTVASINDAPDANNDAPTIAEDSGATDIAVLNNDTDADADTLSVTSVTQGAHGAVAITGGTSVSYTPAPNYFGPDSFTYTISDGQGGADTATVNVNITNVNDAPVATGEAYSTNSNTTLNVPAPGALANDTDIDSSALSARLVSNVAHGALTLNADGSFSYTPSQNYAGPDSFTYYAYDGAANSNTVTVNITVNDKVAPTLTSSVAITLLSQTNSNLVNVGLTATATDNVAGPVAITVAVFGDEDDETATLPGVVHSPDARDIAPNTLRLRAERVEANDGRVYLIIVTATDAAGNVSRNYHTVVVPKSNKQANINSVHAQAAAAIAYSMAHNGAPPAGYFVIGDGAVVGPKQ